LASSACAWIVSGGGGGITSENVPDADGDDDEYGFVDITLSPKEIMIEMISHGGLLRDRKCVTQRKPQGTSTAQLSGTSLCEEAELAERTPAPTPSTPQPTELMSQPQATLDTVQQEAPAPAPDEYMAPAYQQPMAPEYPQQVPELQQQPIQPVEQPPPLNPVQRLVANLRSVFR